MPAEDYQHRNNPMILVIGPDHPDTVTRWAWPGGYPVFYVTDDGGVLCPACVQEEIELCCDPDESGWYVTAHGVNYEDPELYCDHCSERIESAYAEEE